MLSPIMKIGNAGKNDRAEGNGQRPEAEPVDRVGRSLPARGHRFGAGFRGQMDRHANVSTRASPSLSFSPANSVPALI